MGKQIDSSRSNRKRPSDVLSALAVLTVLFLAGAGIYLPHAWVQISLLMYAASGVLAFLMFGLPAIVCERERHKAERLHRQAIVHPPAKARK